MQHISISKLSTFWNAFSTTYACIYKVTHFVWAVQIECIPHKCKLELAAGVVSPPLIIINVIIQIIVIITHFGIAERMWMDLHTFLWACHAATIT